jgi:steroid delta-isomerase-like uncharacterized protein
MSATENEALIRSYWEEAWSKGDLSLVGEVYSPTFIHDDGRTLTVDQFKRRIASTRETMPDLRININEIFTAGEKTVVTRVTYTGTMTGPLGNTPATGKQAKFTGIDIFHFHDGKVVEHWHEADHLTMMGQLGLIPV